jgi:BMFP domain-containing protein YqiC
MILKKNFSKFPENELKDFASRLSYLLPEARKEGRDAESAFEQFLLEAF